MFFSYFDAEKLGYNLIDYLLELIIYRDEEGDEISAQALDCLVRRGQTQKISS